MASLPSSIARIATPLGMLEVEAHGRGIKHVAFTDLPETPGQADAAWLREAVTQLQEYAHGQRTAFHSLPLCLVGTAFQADVWSKLLEVPYGETITYAALAEKAGHPGAARAVGNAVNANPICIIVPCHRVVAAGGGGGYAYGIETKEKLLRLERGLVTR